MAKKPSVLSAVLLLLAITFSGCGGIKEESESSGTPKITITPTEIDYQTQHGDLGTWNSTQIVISTFSSESGTDTPVNGSVRISNTSDNVKIYDQDYNLLQSGAEITTIDGAYNLRIDYYSQSKPDPVEYATNVIFQFQSASAALTIKVTKPSNVSLSLKSSPEKIEYKTELGDTGTWRTTNATVILFDGTQPVSDDLFVFLSDTTYVKITDTKGNSITAGTVQTDEDGKSILIIQYYTKEGLEYSTSIQVFYGSTSLSIPVNITTETPIEVTTTIIPDKLDYEAPAEDTGTWRDQIFTVCTKDEDGYPVEDAKLNLSVSSVYTDLDKNGQLLKSYSTTTDSNGIYTAKVRYYTQSSPSKVEYTAYLTANETTTTLTITAAEQVQKTYSISLAPTSFTYTYTGSDTGTWRTQWFVIVVTDNLGNLIPDADLTIVSPYSQYTKLYDGVAEKPSPMVVKTDANGQYNLRVDFYTQADYSTNPSTKITYSGQLIISYKQYIKTVNFIIQ